MNISGNTIFIPGSTSGIGLTLALALEAKGNTVISGGRRTEILGQIAEDLPREFRGIVRGQRLASAERHDEDPDRRLRDGAWALARHDA